MTPFLLAIALGVAPSADVPLRTYAFPDGTGRMGLAKGWRTDADSALRAVLVKGPDGAQVVIGAFSNVLTPDSPPADVARSLVAPFGSIPETLRVLAPQLSRMSVRSGGPARVLDNVKLVEERKANLANGRAAVVTLGVTETDKRGQTMHFRSLSFVEMDPVTATSWKYWITEARAPDATFERDLPVMLQMIASLKTDPGAVKRVKKRAAEAPPMR